jgi:hypothetical protein
MTTRVATHVISCALCRAESSELADCVRQVASLPEIDPPLGFAQRVMAHVRDIEPAPSLWQRLMLSLTRRAPVRATALAVVAIGAIALYQKEQPLKQNSDVNLALNSTAQTQVIEQVKENEPTATSATPVAAPKDRAIDAMKTASVPAQVAKASDMESSPRAGSSVPAQSPQVTAPTLVRSEKETSREETIVAPKRPPLRVQEVTTARDGDSVFGETRGFGVPFPASLGASRQPALRPAPMALERAVPLGERIADFEFTVRRRSPQRRDQVQNLGSSDALQKSNETENPSPATSLPSTPPAAARAKIESIAEFRFYNVAPEHFEIFKKELATEANIESEPKATAKEIEAARQADRQLLIKVTILPADVAAPSR